jgi:ATP-dependent Clp protease ATP-binding subunit ClpA
MFENFTEKARKSIFFARYEAVIGRIETIEPEYLLLGIMREDKNLLKMLLPKHSISIDDLRNKIEEYNSSKKIELQGADITLSIKSKEVIINAKNISRMYNHSRIDTIHLLYGLYEVSNGVIENIIDYFDIKKEKVEYELKIFESQGDNKNASLSKQKSESTHIIDNRIRVPITKENITFDELKEIISELRNEAFGLVRKCIWINEIIDEMKHNYEPKKKMENDDENNNDK